MRHIRQSNRRGGYNRLDIDSQRPPGRSVYPVGSIGFADAASSDKQRGQHMSITIIAFMSGIVFSILCNVLAKALGRKMANTERLLP